MGEARISAGRYFHKRHQSNLQRRVLMAHEKKARLSMIFSVSNRRKVRFMMTKKAVNEDILFAFMHRLLRDTRRKIFLVVDGLLAENERAFMKWLEGHPDEMEVFHIPRSMDDAHAKVQRPGRHCTKEAPVLIASMKQKEEGGY